MFEDLKPSHLLLIFLSGGLGLILLVPLVLYAATTTNGAPGSIAAIYASAIAAAGETGTGGTVLSLAVSFFIGTALDGFNVIAIRGGRFNRVKRAVASMTGFADRLTYIEQHRGTSAIKDVPTVEPSPYISQLVWQAERPVLRETRGWEWFLAQSFTILTLTVGIQFWLVLLTCIVMWLRSGHLPADWYSWPIVLAALYSFLVPGEIFHRYVRTRTELFLEKEREDHERKARATESAR